MVYLPSSIDISKTYLGHGEVVFWSNYFWWFAYALGNFLSPLHHSYIFYPLGLDITDSLFPPLLFIPVTTLFGSIISYNLYVLSTFVFAGYGMFLLGMYLLKDPYASFVMGVIFSFCPFHFAASFGHVHTLSIQWIPFYFLFFLKMIKDPKPSNILFSSVFFAINALTSWTITIMLILFSAIYLLYYYKITMNKNNLIILGKFIILSVVFSAPGLFLILKNMLTNENMVKNIDSFVQYSSDIAGFFIPSPINPIFGFFTDPIYAGFTGNYSENIIFIGYTVLFLSVICARSLFKDKFFRFLLICTCIFFILSLGPVLHIFGMIRFTDLDLTLMLPGILPYYIPFLNMIRAPSRYDIMVMFCLAIIAGYGLKTINDKYFINQKKKLFFCIIVILLIIIEFSAVLPVQDVKQTPDFYFNLLHNKEPILEIPIIWSPIDKPPYTFSMILYYEYQKVHNRPIFGGYWSRSLPMYTEYLSNDPILSKLFFGTEKKQTVENIDPLVYLNFRYNISHIILHPSLLQEKDYRSLLDLLGDEYTIDTSTSDKLMIYNLTQYINELSDEEFQYQRDLVNTITNKLYVIGDTITFNEGGNSVVYQASGWYGQEKGFTWTKGNSASIIMNISETINETTLNLLGHALTGPGLQNQSVNIEINNISLSDSFALNNTAQQLSIPIPQGYLIDGMNNISINLPNATSPKALGINNDSRILGIAVRSISISS